MNFDDELQNRLWNLAKSRTNVFEDTAGKVNPVLDFVTAHVKQMATEMNELDAVIDRKNKQIGDLTTQLALPRLEFVGADEQPKQLTLEAPL